MKKHWYDYLWVLSAVYLALGFFNILFAWLGLLCFFLPLLISLIRGTKGYCNRYCGRGQLLSLLGGRLGLSRKRDMPRWMRSRAFRYGFLAFFLTMFLVMLWNTYPVSYTHLDVYKRQVHSSVGPAPADWGLIEDSLA